MILESFTFFVEVPMFHQHCCQLTWQLYQCSPCIIHPSEISLATGTCESCYVVLLYPPCCTCMAEVQILSLPVDIVMWANLIWERIAIIRAKKSTVFFHSIHAFFVAPPWLLLLRFRFGNSIFPNVEESRYPQSMFFVVYFDWLIWSWSKSGHCYMIDQQAIVILVHYINTAKIIYHTLPLKTCLQFIIAIIIWWCLTFRGPLIHGVSWLLYLRL